jgi:hypothetical protein
LAAKWLAGLVEIKPTTKLAAEVFDVSIPLIMRELAKVEAAPKNGAINSTTNATTISLSDEERAAVARTLGETELWHLLELATA